MKKLAFILATLALMGFADLAGAVEFAFHGDMNNRFLIYTNRQDWLNNEQEGIIEDSNVEAYYGELKYRFWFEAADDDDNVKGVYAVEIGGIRFGEGTDGDFSGDGVDVETRWAWPDALENQFILLAGNRNRSDGLRRCRRHAGLSGRLDPAGGQVGHQ
jgi:hypothetical protein